MFQKSGIFLLFCFTISLNAQDNPRLTGCETRNVWLCNPDSAENCGTFEHPALMRIDPVNCPDSMYDADFIYSLVRMGIPGDSVERFRKIPADRYVYFITKGKAKDSFVLNLDGSELKFIRKDNGWQITQLAQGLRKSFHLDIKVSGTSMVIDKMGNGEILVTYRKPKE